MGDAGQGKADYVEVVAFDTGDVAAGAALDGVGAGFIVGFFGPEVAGDFFSGELDEMDERGFDEAAALGVGETDEGDAGEDRMGAAGKFFEHVAGIVRGAGFAEDAAFESYDGVRGEDNGGAYGAGGDEFSFGVCEALDVIGRGFLREGSLVDGGGHHDEGEAGVVKNFGATGGGGGEDEFHGRLILGRILQAMHRNSLTPVKVSNATSFGCGC